MNFFEHKADAKRNTVWLYLLFFCATLVIIVAVYMAATVSLYLLAFSIRELSAPDTFFEFNRFIITSLLTIAVILAGSMYKIKQLRMGGGIAVARMLGGRRLRASKDPIERQLRNVIEEMAVASGVLTPAIFIMEQPGINAFAAGFGQKDTVITVTRGAMEMLNRDELQGVIAHEFSHILHGDTLIKMRMMGLLHGITMISDFGILLIAGRHTLKYSSRKRALHPVMMLSGVLFFSVGLLGMLAADFIKAAMSRQREFLADASAVQFTRNPEGIGNALKVIGGYKAGSRLNLPEVQQVSHLFFGEALQVWWQSNWWASHPPLLARIQRIEPKFRGHLNEIDESAVRFLNQQHAANLFSPPPTSQQLQLNVEQVMASIGEPEAKHLDQAHYVLQQIPDEVHDLFGEKETARAMIYNLLLDDDKRMVTQQLDLIAEVEPSSVLAEVLRIRGLMPKIKAELRLPLLDLLSPHLMSLDREAQKLLLVLMKKLVSVNDQVSLFEYLIYQHFLNLFGFKGTQQAGHTIGIERFKAEVLTILGMVCSINKNKKPRRVYQDAAAELFPGYKVKPMNKPDLQVAAQALEKINACSFEDKKCLLKAIVFCVLSDGIVTTEELETVRLIATLLACPMPILSVTR